MLSVTQQYSRPENLLQYFPKNKRKILHILTYRVNIHIYRTNQVRSVTQEYSRPQKPSAKKALFDRSDCTHMTRGQTPCMCTQKRS